ncbi:hypothetical protein N9L76_06225 [bacterium]|nr:hypothetical protein [bacterium]
MGRTRRGPSDLPPLPACLPPHARESTSYLTFGEPLRRVFGVQSSSIPISHEASSELTFDYELCLSLIVKRHKAAV